MTIFNYRRSKIGFRAWLTPNLMAREFHAIKQSKQRNFQYVVALNLKIAGHEINGCINFALIYFLKRRHFGFVVALKKLWHNFFFLKR